MVEGAHRPIGWWCLVVLGFFCPVLALVVCEVWDLWGMPTFWRYIVMAFCCWPVFAIQFYDLKIAFSSDKQSTKSDCTEHGAADKD